jgi:excisionase family DNA binding protein
VTAVERIGIGELARRLGFSRATIGRWTKLGKLPAPHFLGEQRRWFVHEIEAWETAEARPDRPRKRASKRAAVEAA